MEQNNQNTETNSSAGSQESISFLKIDALKKGSHAMSLLLKTNDIIVGLDKEPFRGTQKTLTQKLKEKPTTVLTILRKESFFNILAKGPLGIKLIETGSDEDITILEKVKSYLKSIDSFDNYKEFEVFRGRNNIYNVIEVNENSLFASLFPLVWLFHYKLYIPLVLVIMLFLLLGTIEWWLLLSSWVILTIYMSKGSMSLLRGYCMFNEMRMYSRFYAKSVKNVQLNVREQDKKANFIFAQIEAAQEDSQTEGKGENNLATQSS